MTAPPRALGRLLRYRVHAAKVIRPLAQATAQQTRAFGNVRLVASVTRATLVTVPFTAAVHQVVQRHLLTAAVHEIGTRRVHRPLTRATGGQ